MICTVIVTIINNDNDNCDHDIKNNIEFIEEFEESDHDNYEIEEIPDITQTSSSLPVSKKREGNGYNSYQGRKKARVEIEYEDDGDNNLTADNKKAMICNF